MDFALLNMMGGGEGGNTWTMLPLLLGFVGIMYMTMIRPQKKRQKEESSMRDNIQIGDEITTIGGILGRVITVKEDSIIIETGADRTKLRILRTAVGINNSAQEKLAAEREAAQRAQQEARAEQLEESGKKRKKSKKNKDD